VKSLDAFDWAQVEGDLDAQGNAMLSGLFTEPECLALADGLRSAPLLTDDLTALRAGLYERLVGTANRWEQALGRERRYPGSFVAFSRERCVAGQAVERTALRRLRAGEHRALHRDTEDDQSFPFQVSALLSRPESDFVGGELVMTEQRPRMQSRPMVLAPKQGDAVIFTAYGKPFRGTKGFYRVSLKHAVSRVRDGERVALELFFGGA
jgi:hypothetical protein